MSGIYMANAKLSDQGTGCKTNEIRGGNIFNDIYNAYNGISTSNHKHLNIGEVFTYFAWGFPQETVPIIQGGSTTGVTVNNCGSGVADLQSCLPKKTSGPKSGDRLGKHEVEIEKKIELNEKIRELLLIQKIKEAIILMERTHYPDN